MNQDLSVPNKSTIGIRKFWEPAAWIATIVSTIYLWNYCGSCITGITNSQLHKFNYLFIAMGIVVFAGVISSWRSTGSYRPDKAFTDDFRIAALLLLLGFQGVIFMVMKSAMFEGSPASEFPAAKVEWFIALISIVGVIGAIWAVLAKVEAHNAFEEAQKAVAEVKNAVEEAQKAVAEAHQANQAAVRAQETAEKTYLSITGSFEFREILNENVDFMLPFHLKRAQQEPCDLILFLGFPAVGMFYKKAAIDLTGSAIFFYRNLNSVLYYLRDINLSGRTLRIVCFSRRLVEKYLNDAEREGVLSQQTIGDFTAVANDFYRQLEILHQAHPNEFKFTFIEEEIGLRFAISKNINESDRGDEKAIVWMVSDFRPGNKGTLADFKSAGFKTRDPEIIHVLRDLCDDYIKNTKADIDPTHLSTSQETITDGNQIEGSAEQSD